MSAKLTVKICSLPIECPATCDLMHSIVDQVDNEVTTFCNEAENECPFANTVVFEAKLEEPILTMDR